MKKKTINAEEVLSNIPEIKKNVYQKVAQMMLDELEKTKADKTKPLKEQCNEEQLKTVEYLEMVIKTGQP